MAVASPALILHPHPLVGDGSVVVVDAFLPNETLGAYIKRTGVIVPAGPVAVWHRGCRVPDSLWRRLIPRAGDQVIIRARVIGGGDSNKIIASVLTIALVLAAPYMAGYALGGSWATMSGFAATALTAGIAIAGSLVINALLPLPGPTAAQLGTGQKYESSPTYALSGGRNRMRPWEPMTLVFGRHKVVPDLAAKYYTEWVGDTQYLNQAFHFGLQAGECELTDFKIGATPIENYQDVQIQISGADGKLSMFPGNVDTIQGFVMESGVVNSRTTAQDVTSISVELAAQLFSVSDTGSFAGMTVEMRIQYRKVGDPDWTDIGQLEDATYATHYWALNERYVAGESESGGQWYGERQIQYGSTNYGDHTPGDEVVLEAPWCPPGDNGYCRPGRYAYWRWTPHPYQSGRPWTGIAPNPLISVSTHPGVRMYGARQEATRKTVTWDVAKGQYEVRLWKVTGDIKNSRQSNETAVGQILVYQTDEADYTGQLRVATRIKATSQLSGPVDELSAIAHAHAPTWTGEQWDLMETSNPAAWFLWFARGKSIEGKGRQYGDGLPDSDIDIEALKAWGAFCDEKKLTFNYVLDRKTSSDQMLQVIARAGRASVTRQTGKLGVVWDAADQPVVAMFGPFNIRAGTFKIAYTNEGTVDEIVGNFTNPDREWGMDEVRVRVPGATTTTNPLQLDLEGCTDPDMAGREVNLIAASQVFHRRRVSWETDIEGHVAGRGDVIQASHDLTEWGYSGRFLALLSRSEVQVPFDVMGQTVFKTLVTVRVSLSGTMPSGGSGIAMLRDPEGAMKVVSITTDVGDIDEIELSLYEDEFHLPGSSYFEGVETVDWAFFFDPLATPGRRLKIIETKPAADNGVAYTLIDDDPEYYASESNPYIYTPPRDGAYLGGVIFGVTVTEGIVNVLADINSVQIGWAISVAMPVDVVIAVNGVAQPTMRIVDRKTAIQAQTGDVLDITITPVSQAGRGKPAIQRYTVLGLTAPLPAVTGLTNVFRDGLTVLVWNRVVDVRQPDYEIRMGESWANSRTVAITPMLESLTAGNGLYWVAARFAAKGTVIYGPPDSLSVSGASLVRNVLLTEVEDPAWGGVLSDGTYIWDDMLTLVAAGDILSAPDVLAVKDMLWYGGAETYGTYESTETVDIGFVAPVRLEFSIGAYALNFGEDVLAMADVLANPDILNASNAQHWKVTPQYRSAADDEVYTGWLNYTPGLVNARHFQVRLVIETDDPLIVPFVEHFTWIVDVPDLVQSAESVAVPLNGMRVTYGKAFHAVPNVQITTFDALDGDRYVLTGSDETGFDIQLFNGSTAKSRVINWIAQGF